MAWLNVALCQIPPTLLFLYAIEISIAKSCETKTSTYSRTVRDSATLTQKHPGLRGFFFFLCCSAATALFSTMIVVFFKMFQDGVRHQRGLKVLKQDYDGERKGHRWFTEVGKPQAERMKWTREDIIVCPVQLDKHTQTHTHVGTHTWVQMPRFVWPS